MNDTSLVLLQGIDNRLNSCISDLIDFGGWHHENEETLEDLRRLLIVAEHLLEDLKAVYR